MKVGIIDADLIGRKRHRFPNLACMKLSGYHKARGDEVVLKTQYDYLVSFNKIYIAKVFTDTPIPQDGGLFGSILAMPNVEFGGTGFFGDAAPPLPNEIEHHMPDYHLYDDWLATVDKGGAEFKAYRDYSIGYLTRGCFRHCPFCVNRRCNEVVKHSPLEEFLDTTRRKICLLDDNFFGFSGWKEELQKLIDTGKRFCFKQGLDVRLLDEEKAEMLFSAKYDGEFIFAFDDWSDAELIEEKLKLIRRHVPEDKARFYVLCGYDRRGVYDEDFWYRDLKELILRLKMLKSYGVLAYVMRFEKVYASKFHKVYHDIATWAKLPNFFKKTEFLDWLVGFHWNIFSPRITEIKKLWK